jgi:hypothetical protein
MLVAEILTGKACESSSDIQPSEDEIKAIQLDKKIKRRPKARDMLFTVMPGNTSTYPFQ